MNISNASNRSRSADAQQTERYKQMLEKVNIQRLILAAVNDVKADDVTEVTNDERKRIQRVLNDTRASKYLKLDDQGTRALGKFFSTKCFIAFEI